jgi:hypothetical protein
MRKAAFWAAVGVALIGVFGTATFALAHGFKKDLSARDLSSYNEAPMTLSTTGSGWFRARVDDKADKIDYTIHYEGLEGDVTQSHIHLGARGIAGGIMVWLCQTTTNPAPAAVAATTPTCPGTREGTVSGSLTAASVIGPAAQGIAPGEFDEVLRAIRAGAAYANVHTKLFPSGEIRAQVNASGHGFGRDR